MFLILLRKNADHVVCFLVHNMDSAAVHIEDDIISVVLVLMYHQRYLSFIFTSGLPACCPVLLPQNVSADKRKAAAFDRCPHLCSLFIGEEISYFFCSHVWFPTVQDVLHADWHDVWHSPHPPLFTVLFSVCVFNVLMCFMS